MKKNILILALLLAGGAAEASEKEVFQAMQSEIARAMKDLRMEGMESPYFISLRMQDLSMQTLYSASGALVQRTGSETRFAEAVVRVGSPAMDQTNFKGEYDYGMRMGARPDLPYADDIPALRQAYWILIDRAYKQGLEQLSKKRGFLEKHPQDEYPADFLPSPEKTEVLLPAPAPVAPEGPAPLVERLSDHMRRYPLLTEGLVRLVVGRVTQYYLDSEGNRHVRPDIRILLAADFKALTKDGYPLGDGVQWIGANAEELGGIEALERELGERIARFHRLLDQKPLEEYTGPVVFAGEAAGQLLMDLLGKGISAPREPLSGREEGYFNPFESAGGFLAKRFGLRVLPASFDVWDRPTAKTHEGRSLHGYMPVDDEGMKARDIQVIAGGRLVALPMRRTATPKYAEANGHARGSMGANPFQTTEATVTNLFVEDKAGLDEEAFRAKVRALARVQGLKEVLVVRTLKGATLEDMESIMLSFRSGGPSRLSAPSAMDLLDLETGAVRPVWGLEFSNANEGLLNSIVASTKTVRATPVLSLAGGSSSAPVSVVAPDLLVEEMTLQKAKIQRRRPPALEMPLLEPELSH